eukprot:799589-Pleurochrysis_carterae.AAC.3
MAVTSARAGTTKTECFGRLRARLKARRRYVERRGADEIGSVRLSTRPCEIKNVRRRHAL